MKQIMLLSTSFTGGDGTKHVFTVAFDPPIPDSHKVTMEHTTKNRPHLAVRYIEPPPVVNEEGYEGESE